MKWNMTKGSKYGFAVALGIHRFTAAGKNRVTLSAMDAKGLVLADAVAFVKASDEVSDK
jgi:hypothetical protein